MQVVGAYFLVNGFADLPAFLVYLADEGIIHTFLGVIFEIVVGIALLTRSEL